MNPWLNDYSGRDCGKCDMNIILAKELDKDAEQNFLFFCYDILIFILIVAHILQP